jgi:hypothetical protein
VSTCQVESAPTGKSSAAIHDFPPRVSSFANNLVDTIPRLSLNIFRHTHWERSSCSTSVTVAFNMVFWVALALSAWPFELRLKTRNREKIKDELKSVLKIMEPLLKG